MTIKEFYGNAAGDIALLWPGAVAATYGHRSGAAEPYLVLGNDTRGPHAECGR